MKVGTTISYLGIEIGEVTDINFASINNEDYVLASIELNDQHILNKHSYITWSEYGTLEVINTEKSNTLQVGDTLFLKSKQKASTVKTENIITPINSKDIDNKETELLPPEDQHKLDSLQAKINKLNNLIQEVNDQD